MQLSQDRKHILNPILEFFDAAWLAPKRSPLFERQWCKSKNYDDTRFKRMREDINEKLFRELVRIPLERILGVAYMNDFLLAARYRKAAKKIVTKRRANHVQAWRPEKGGTHKPLRYGGKLGVNPATGNSVFAEEAESTLSRRAVEEAEARAQRAQRAAEKAQARVKRAQRVIGGGAKAKKARLSFVDMSQSAPAASTVSAVSHSESLSADFEEEMKEECVDCLKRLSEDEIFPRDDDDWDLSICKEVRCADCWDKEVQSNMMPMMYEKQNKQQEFEESKQNDKQKKQKKQSKGTRVKKKPCKHCGSKTHSVLIVLTIREIWPNATPIPKMKR